MSPTIVERNGRPVLAVGSPGGATIITTVAQVLLERFEFGRPLPDAVAAPRVSSRNAATIQAEPGFIASPEGQALAARGHRFSSTDLLGVVAAVEVTPDGLLAVAEPTRRGGGAAGAIDRGQIRER
jgi:gamma-glutamyltranspeptidase/glutathione hydrolase